MEEKSRLFPVIARTNRPLKQLSDHLYKLVQSHLWLKVVIAMVAGMATGMVLGPSLGWVNPDTGAVIGSWLAFPGHLFLAVIQMIVIPLVFASIIRGLAAGENLEQLRRMGLLVVGYFVATTLFAAGIGLWIANLIQPGQFLDPSQISSSPDSLPDTITTLEKPSLSSIPDHLLGILPGNPLQSMAEGQMLQVVIFAVMVGVALISMTQQQARPMLDLLGSLQQVCMTVVRWAMRLAPIAVFGLMARLTSQTGLDALIGMAIYVATVLAGLFLLLISYLILVSVLGKIRIGPFMASVREVMLLAFSTSSSAAVMPLSIKTAEDKLHVRPAISQFVIPLGATINMNGTALYQAIAAVFLAQVFQIDIGLGGMALVVIMAVGASIGSPGTPGVGIVILATTLATIGVPATGVALIMGVDRILDMSRTAINVTGDLVAAKLMNRWIKEDAARQTPDA